MPLTLRRLVLALAAPCVAGSLAAQQGSQSSLVLSIGLGVHTGHGLWTIPSQPVSLLNSNPPVYDSLRLVRTISPGIIATAAGTLFPSSHVGVNGQVTFLDMSMENSCTPVAAYQPDFQQRNQQLCENIDGSVSSNSAILLGLGVTLRAAPRGGTSPYVRAGLGYAIYGDGTVGMIGNYVVGGQIFARQIIADDTPKPGSFTAQVGVGITQPFAAGYQLRLEVRDDIMALERATGPANALGQLTTDVGWYHHWGLTIGLDIVLERKRGRRY